MIETNSQINSMLRAVGVGGRDWEKKKKREAHREGQIVWWLPGEGGKVEEYIGEINGDGKVLNWGGEHTIQYT